MSQMKITKTMLDQLEYDTKDMSEKMQTIAAPTAVELNPTVQVVFEKSDLHAAAHYLAKSMEAPFAKDAIYTLLVEESIHDQFIAILQGMLPLNAHPELTANAGFIQAWKTIERMQLKFVASPVARHGHVPALVADVTHEQLGVDVRGLVTLHTFRTAKEAIALAKKESIVFKNVSIWHENHACAYEIVFGLSSANFFINCNQVSLEPVQKQAAAGQSVAVLHKNYHYETLVEEIGGVVKSVVFPFGTIFAN